MSKYLFACLILAFCHLSVCLTGQELMPVNRVWRLGDNVNTANAEMAPYRYADKLYFTSVVEDEKSGKKISRTFSALGDERSFQLEENPREQNVHMAHIALPLKADRMYYSLFREGRTSSAQEGSQLWYRDRNYDGTWGHPVRLPRHINLPGYFTSHPAIGFDKKLNKQVLFFVSNRPGGKGGLDIWYSVLEPDHAKGTIHFSEPVNMPINTARDDVSPYFHSLSQTLFFSSTGYRGYGGFDIYQTVKQEDGTWSNPVNFEEPVNSDADDLYFTFHDGSRTGYFSSNRPSESCPEDESDCRGLDIFQTKILTELEIEVFRADDKSLLTGCNVELVNQATGAIESSLVSMEEPIGTLHLVPETDYQIIVSQKNYYPVFMDVRVEKNEIFSFLSKRIFVKPMSSVVPVKGEVPSRY